MGSKIFFVVMFLIAGNVYADDAVDLASNLGSQLGKAMYCGYDTEEFAKLSGKAIDAKTSYGTPERGAALKQFMLSASVSVKTGPVTESCSEFREGYEGSLNILQEQF